MRFKKGSKEAKAFMAKIRAKKGKKTATKKPVKKISGSYAMFTKKGNDEVTKIVKYAKAKKLSWQAVLNMLDSLSNKYPEAYDTHVREKVYESFMKNKPAKKEVKKIGATKKPKVKTVETHKDTKSHNVNIRVVSGLEKYNNKIIDELNYLSNKIANFEIHRDLIKFNIKYKKYNKENLPLARKRLKETNEYIKHLKAVLRATKKHVK